VSLVAPCAMVIGDPHLLPMSPGAAAAAGVPGTAGVDATAGASSVHRPEKSAVGCAERRVAQETASSSAASSDCRILISPVATSSYGFGGR